MYKEMYLMLTELCPNRCEYCYIKDRANPKTISMETVKNVITKHDPNRIILFGGEPLADFRRYSEVVTTYYGTRKLQVVTSTSANFKEFLNFNKIFPLDEVQISWDGFNKNRLNAGKKDTSYATFDNIEYAIKRGLKFDIKAVISNNNIKQITELHTIFKQLKPYGVSGQFVIAHRDLYTESFYTGLKENLIKTFDLDKMYTDHLNKIIAYLNQDKSYSSCDGGKYVVIDPDGRESCCTALSQEKNLVITSDEIQKPSLDPDCKDCKYSYLCDGGCRYERYNAYGADWQKHKLESTCMMMKIYDETISEWLQSLKPAETKKLFEIIKSYKSYLRGYYSC